METSSKNRTIYFDERLHKYTDHLGNVYTSVTTVISKYENKFDELEVAKRCAAIGRNPSHPKYEKYKNKSVKQILAGWSITRETALDNGKEKHSYLELSIKKATGYNLNLDNVTIKGKIYTLDDVIENPGYGELTLSWFITTGIDKRYPTIFKDLVTLANYGYRFYAEIGVYDSDLLISGLIDLFITNGINFIIFDWKTNKSDIRYESGFYEKDNQGNLTDRYILKNEYMKPPLTHLPDSVGNHYAIQTCGYAWFAIQKGLIFLGTVIYQVREDEHTGLEYVNKITVPNRVMDAEVMFRHHAKEIVRKTQTKLFI